MRNEIEWGSCPSSRKRRFGRAGAVLLTTLACGSDGDGTRVDPSTRVAANQPGDAAEAARSGSDPTDAPGDDAASGSGENGAGSSGDLDADREGPLLSPRITPASDEDDDEDYVDFGVTDEPEQPQVCAAQAAASELSRVYLAFAVDISASMGAPGADGAPDARRQELKWAPIVAASEAFFAEPDSAAVSASLTFFPTGGPAERCSDSAYGEPVVPQTLLPSRAFSDAIVGLEMQPGGDARFATPTLAAFNGTAASLAVIDDDAANVKKAIVLVTDGVPQTCQDEAGMPIGVSDVARAVEQSGIVTYVIGVENLPNLDGGPGNLQGLDAIAQAGGTERAFIVHTGDPTETEAEFKAVIDGIRGVSVSCNIEIPIPPAGSEFIPEKVNVTYSGADVDDIRMSYDPACEAADTWRYDDPDAPTTIELCDAACGTVQRDVSASITVEFGCARRDIVR